MSRREKWVALLVLLLAFAALLGVWLARPPVGESAEEPLLLQMQADCDVSQNSCLVVGESLALEVAFAAPVRPMEPFAISVHPVRDGLSASAAVELQFQMRGMDMGLNRYRLNRDEQGVWRGQAILPMCRSGRSDWIAMLDIRDEGRRWSAELPFTAAGRNDLP